MDFQGKKRSLWGSAVALSLALAACTGSGPLAPVSDDGGNGDDLGPVASEGIEFEGVVVSVDPAGGTFTLDDGTVVHVADDATWDEGDLESLEDLADALSTGATVRVEGRVSDDGAFEATLVEFEVDDEADGEAEDEDDGEAEDEADGEGEDEDDGEGEDEDDGEGEDEDDQGEDEDDQGEDDGEAEDEDDDQREDEDDQGEDEDDQGEDEDDGDEDDDDGDEDDDADNEDGETDGD